MAGIHGLQHVKRLAAAAFADDDAIGAHAQRVDHQLADRNRASALDARRLGLERDHVLLLELQLGRILDGDNALGFRNEAGENVEQRGLAGAGAAGDTDILPIKNRKTYSPWIPTGLKISC